MKTNLQKNYYKTVYMSPIGKISIVSDGETLVGLWIEGQQYFEKSVQGELITKDDLPVFIQTKEWLDRYFAGGKPDISELSLTPEGSEFRQTVWSVLREIPYGETITYGEIGKRISKMKGIERMSAQAIGGAVGHNPISIIIPCHRVIGANGKLTGYSGGIELKISLLQHEGIDIKKLK